MDFTYLKLVLHDFTLNQLFIINWFNNNLDKNWKDRISIMPDLLNECDPMAKEKWSIIKIEQVLMVIDGLGFLNKEKENDLQSKLHNYFASKQRPDAKVEPYIKHCCNKKLKMLQGRNITVFNINGSYRSTMVNGYCEKCQKKYSHNYFIEKGGKYVTCNSIFNDNLIYFGGDYAYEKDLIQWLSNCILYLYSGFENFTNCYNATNNSYCSNADYYRLVEKF